VVDLDLDEDGERKRRPDEADLSAEPNSSETKPRFSGQNALAERADDLEAPTSEGPKAASSLDPLEITVFVRGGYLTRADRLLSSRDFRRVTRVGDRTTSRYFVVLLARSRRAETVESRRLGITVSRRVGNAVVRNRIKRGVREWFRWSRSRLKPGVDIVVVGRQEAARLSAGEIRSVLDQMLFSDEQVEA
jgi:ribonuclease P protein component